MIEINNKTKIDILLFELQERYNASHHIRERGFKTVVALTGASIALSWFLITKISLGTLQQITLTSLLTVLFIGVGYFLNSLRCGSVNNRKGMINIETALKMYENSAFLKNKTILPTEYSDIKHKKFDIFPIFLIWIGLIWLSLIVLVWIPSNNTNLDNDRYKTKIEINNYKGK